MSLPPQKPVLQRTPTQVIVAVAGGSGSGKTTFARYLAASLNGFSREEALNPKSWNGKNAIILSQDNYYIDQSHKFVRDGGDEVNFDHPNALEFDLLAHHLAELRAGRDINVPVYDFSTHTRKPETLHYTPTPVVIVDGILILTQPQVVKHFDEVIFLDIDEPTRFERRFRRDVQERGRSPEGVREQFLRQVKPMHDQFVQPSIRYAKRVITNSETFEECLHTVSSLLKPFTKPVTVAG